jgi:hypothetical protein
MLTILVAIVQKLNVPAWTTPLPQIPLMPFFCNVATVQVLKLNVATVQVLKLTLQLYRRSSLTFKLYFTLLHVATVLYVASRYNCTSCCFTLQLY